MILIPLMFVMLLSACVVSFSTQYLLKGWIYRVFFFLFGAVIPIIDVPYVKYLHNSYCEGNIDLQVYKEIAPQESYYIESSSRISFYDFFSEKIKFIEHYDPRKQELWKVTRVGDELVEEPINEISSTYQFVDQGRTYLVDYGIEKVISRQIIERTSTVIVAETIGFTNVKQLGWFFAEYYESGKSCNVSKKSWEVNRELKSLLVTE